MNQLSFAIRPQILKDPELVEDWEISHCETFQQALRLSLSRSKVRRSQENWSDLLGYENKGTFNTVLNNDLLEKDFYRETPQQTLVNGGKQKEFRKRFFDPNKIRDTILNTGNLAIVQWLLRGTGYKIVKKSEQERLEEIEAEQKARRIEQLEAELEKLRATG